MIEEYFMESDEYPLNFLLIKVKQTNIKSIMKYGMKV